MITDPNLIGIGQSLKRSVFPQNEQDKMTPEASHPYFSSSVPDMLRCSAFRLTVILNPRYSLILLATFIPVTKLLSLAFYKLRLTLLRQFLPDDPKTKSPRVPDTIYHEDFKKGKSKGQN